MRVQRFLLACVCACFACASCVSVKVYEKERLADRTMVFDYNEIVSTLDVDVLAAREGSIGGFSYEGAGGCSCK